MTLKNYKTLLCVCSISLFMLITGCATLPSNKGIPASAPPEKPLVKQPEVALVLGGGGARGFAHVGVMEVLQEEKIPVDLVVGTSAGSIMGSLYAADPNVHKLKKLMLNTDRSDILDVSALHPLEGPITGSALQNFIRIHTHNRDIQNLKIRFVAVATDLKTGATVPIASGPTAPAVNASSALPPFFHPVRLYGRTLVDGGTTDPVAVDVARRYHPKVIIAVSIVDDLPHQMPTNAIGIYDRSYIISDQRFNNYSTKGADVVIHPYVGQTGTFDDSQKQQLITAGYRATKKALPAICAALKKNHIHSACS